MATLNLDKYAGLENYRILIDLPDTGAGVGSQPQLGRGAIHAFVSAETSIGGSAQFESFNQFGALDAANNAMAALANTVARTQGSQGRGVAVHQIKSIAQTISTWTGSDPFSLTVPIILVSYRRGMDVRREVARLVGATYPNAEGNIWGENFMNMIRPPLGYTATQLVNQGGNAGTIPNGVSVQIGKWLYIPRLLVIRNAEFSLSKEVVEDGSPLYAQGQVTFEAARLIFDSDIKQWLGQVSASEASQRISNTVDPDIFRNLMSQTVDTTADVLSHGILLARSGVTGLWGMATEALGGKVNKSDRAAAPKTLGGP